MYNPLIKFCGNRSFEDWCHVIESKATFIGVIFAQSKRKVKPYDVKQWIHAKPVPVDKKLVGIFVNATVEEIIDVLKEVSLHVIQCHGLESANEVNEIKQKTGLTVWKAIHHDHDSLQVMRAFRGIADGFVVDTKTPEAWGGTGQTFEWSSIPSYLEEANRLGKPCFIAGGVNPDNISNLLTYQPTGIDLASGIELGEQKNLSLIKSIETEVELYVNNVSR